MQDIPFLFASLTFFVFMSSFYYSSTLVNPMLSTYYEITTEKSLLIFSTAAIGFLIGSLTIMYLMKHDVVRRRFALIFGLCVIGLGMIVRTGNLAGGHQIYIVIMGQILNGFGMAFVMDTNLPELMDCVERRPDFHQYNKNTIDIKIPSFTLILQSIGQAIGAFSASFTADSKSYNFTFVVGGVSLFVFASLYATLCGFGETESVKHA